MSKRRKVLIFVLIILILASIAVCIYLILGNMRLNLVPALSFSDALYYTLEDKDDAAITVGVIGKGGSSYKVYGKNREELQHTAREYEIGELTETFTAALVQRAMDEGKLRMSGTLNEYLNLDAGNEYPTIRQLATHTSLFREFYLESSMFDNYLAGRNSYYGINKITLMNRLNKLSIPSGEHRFCYSDFGYAVLGMVLESAYGEDYTTLVNRFTRDELGLTHTRISNGAGDIDGGWDWKSDDVYRSASAMISNINDMLAYARMQFDDEGLFHECHESFVTIDASTDTDIKMGIRMDEVDMAWFRDAERDIVWCSGDTGNYNSYIGLHKKSGTAVVILSNLPLDYRISAKVLGVKLMDEFIK